jgi:hypothetical protein
MGTATHGSSYVAKGHDQERSTRSSVGDLGGMQQVRSRIGEISGLRQSSMFDNMCSNCPGTATRAVPAQSDAVPPRLKATQIPEKGRSEDVSTAQSSMARYQLRRPDDGDDFGVIPSRADNRSAHMLHAAFYYGWQPDV